VKHIFTPSIIEIIAEGKALALYSTRSELEFNQKNLLATLLETPTKSKLAYIIYEQLTVIDTAINELDKLEA